jgi:3-oxoacyl-[acyl-carrier protein] reductase
MSNLLKDKVALVTGGGRGIGEKIALTFAESGADVVIGDIDLPGAESVANKIRDLGGKGFSIELDVRKVEEIYARVAQIRDKYGRIDILVNNAGIAQDLAIEEITENDWDAMLDIDLKGVFFCSQAVYKVMKENNGGRIINIASLAGVRGGRFAGAHYSAAKGGIIVLTKCFALSGGSHNINVNAIAPGLIVTKMAEELGWIKQEHKDIPLGRLGLPEDVANAALFLASGLSAYITGETINLNGGMHMS